MVNPFRSIKARLLTFALCISLIPIAATTTIYYLHVRSALKARIYEDLRAIAESRKQHILSLMEKMRVRTSDFSTDGFIKNSAETILRGGNSKQHAEARLNKYLLMNKMSLSHRLSAISIVDKSGRIVSSTNKKLIGKDVSGQDVFLQGIHKRYGETYVDKRYYSPELDTNCICISSPIISRHRAEPLGMTITAYSFSVLNEITTNHVGLGDTSEIYLVDKNKLLLSRLRFVNNVVQKEIVDTVPVRTFIENGKEMVGVYQDYRGIKVVGASIGISDYGWILLVEIDKAEAFAPLKRMGLFAAFFGVAIAVAVAVLGISFAVSTSVPVRDLKDAVERFARGDLNSRVKMARKDEIGALAGSFNVMAEELKKEITERKRIEEALRTLNNSLEQRIAERTDSLTKANKELKVEIAERKRVEGELRKLFNAVEQSSCSIVITDLKGNIEYVNPRFCRITGYTPEEAIGQNPRILKSGEKSSEEYKCLWDTITAGGEWEGEFHNRKKNGELYWEHASVSPIRNQEGVITHFVAIKEDVTERKQVADELRKQRDHLETLTRQLTASNKELEAFCYSVSHDLRAPLRSINGFSKALMEDYSEKLDSQGTNYLHRVMEASKRMGQLIDDLLNLSRITRSEMHRKTFDLSALAAAIAAKLKASEPERQAEFVIAGGLLANGDPHLIRIALENLMGNAWKFTRKRQRARIEFGITQHNGKPAYFVRDNGAGFDMAFANKLFGAFQRLHSSTDFEGTGIGLATVQRIIHRHGGQILAEGAVDQGAMFSFTI